MVCFIVWQDDHDNNATQEEQNPKNKNDKAHLLIIITCEYQYICSRLITRQWVSNHGCAATQEHHDVLPGCLLNSSDQRRPRVVDQNLWNKALLIQQSLVPEILVSYSWPALVTGMKH